MPAPTPLRRLLLLAALLAAGPAVAQAPGDARLREALRTATNQVRALEDERAQWQAREATLKAELEQARRQAASAPKLDRAGLDLQRRLAEQRDAATKALAACEAKARDGSDAGQAQEAERTRLEAALKVASERAAAGEVRNARMYQVAKGVLDWIEQIGWGEALAAREPLLGLKRVELENLAQDHRDKLLEQRTKTGATP